MCIRSNPKLTKINYLHLLRYTPDQYHIFQHMDKYRYADCSCSAQFRIFSLGECLHDVSTRIFLRQRRRNQTTRKQGMEKTIIDDLGKSMNLADLIRSIACHSRIQRPCF